MATFRISSHGRLQDWIAAEKGYFDDEGLDYELDVRVLENADQDIERSGDADVRVGAYELYRAGGGGKKNMSCACHWAVNQAASDAAGRMWGHAYSILPSGIYVPTPLWGARRTWRASRSLSAITPAATSRQS